MIGPRIRDLRRARGWTQEELAGLCGCTRVAVAQWETDRAEPTVSRLRMIAEAFGITASDLLFEEGSAEPVKALSSTEIALVRHHRELHRPDQTAVLRIVLALRQATTAPKPEGITP